MVIAALSDVWHEQDRMKVDQLIDDVYCFAPVVFMVSYSTVRILMNNYQYFFWNNFLLHFFLQINCYFVS